MNNPASPPNKQRGLALLIALTVVAIATVIATELFTLQKRMLKHTEATRHLEAAWQYAVAGELSAQAVLQKDFDDDAESGLARDTLNEGWAAAGEDVKPVKIDGGTIKVTITDLNRYYNINNFYYALQKKRGITGEGNDGTTPNNNDGDTNSPEETPNAPNNNPDGEPKVEGETLPDYEMLTNVILNTVTDESIRDKIIDWQDSDHKTWSASGAEEKEYQELGYTPANQPMLDKNELALIYEIDPDNLPALLGKVMAVPSQTTININTAPEDVLSQLPDIDTESLNIFIEGGREETDLSNFTQLVALDSKLTSLLSTQSEYFLAETEVTIGTMKVQLYSTLHRDKTGKITVIKRTRIKP